MRHHCAHCPLLLHRQGAARQKRTAGLLGHQSRLAVSLVAVPPAQHRSRVETHHPCHLTPRQRQGLAQADRLRAQGLEHFRGKLACTDLVHACELTQAKVG